MSDKAKRWGPAGSGRRKRVREMVCDSMATRIKSEKMKTNAEKSAVFTSLVSFV